jgi:RhtB (resistance to homoserine/threonine) family protein
MLAMTELIAVITITILAVVSPGPDFAMVTRTSLVVSRRAAVVTALGIGLGVLVHVGYTLLGIGLLISQSLWLFNVFKFAGAAYLVYLGVKMLRAQPADQTRAAAPAAVSDLGALRTGFLTNALNPKTTVFVVSLFMQVVEPATPLPVQLGYGAFIAVAHVVWFTLVALFFSTGAVRSRLVRIRHWIDRAFGAVLVGFGGLLATATLSR